MSRLLDPKLLLAVSLTAIVFSPTTLLPNHPSPHLHLLVQRTMNRTLIRNL